MSPKERDTLFSTARGGVKPFRFDEDVVAVFDDMIGRSVPFYDDMQRATALIAARVVPFGGTVYDLGCSTGTTLLLLARALESQQATIIGVDNSAAMVTACRAKLTAEGIVGRASSAERTSVVVVEADLSDFIPLTSSLIVLNYTLQFLGPDARAEVLARLVASLEPGGVLLLAEKVCHSDPMMQKLLDDTHLDYKRAHGYSELEIRQKRDAIENVLIPLTLEENIQLLEEAGLESVELFAKCINFVTLIGV